MEHIKQFDWCSSKPDVYFLTADDLANSVTEKILRNKFHDPSISSDSEDEEIEINWDEIFAKKENTSREHSIFVPCLSVIQYPKLSALTVQQHYQILKVICAKNPHVLEEMFIPRPTKIDCRVFEELKPTYEKEQKEYKEWAKTLWTNEHCVRALRPKPTIETVYDASFNMRATEMESYPKTFKMAAQIPLETRNGTIDLILDKELINVDIEALPQIECRPITKKLSIMKPCQMPEPCNKHPCRFVLPYEKSVSILPYTEVQNELAQFAVANECEYVASDNALRCLVELDRSWDIPISVCAVFRPDGETTNIVVLGNEFAINRESVQMRTYRAYRHLLQHALLPPAERKKLNYKCNDQEMNTQKSNKTNVLDDIDVSSDDEDNNLCIDVTSQLEPDTPDDVKESDDETLASSNRSEKQNTNTSKAADNMEFYNCTCKDTIFERPPPRSFKKWKILNRTTDENFNIIIHCSHKIRDGSGEVILEPVVEYQLDVGASDPPAGRRRALALALRLRKNVSLINVRVDGATGEVATVEAATAERAAPQEPSGADALHAALAQLQGLRAGRYVLRHEPGHGSNALLFASCAPAAATLQLRPADRPAGTERGPDLPPPRLCDALLPYHKLRRIVPCAFTPHEQHVSRRPPRLRAPRAPPRALQLGADAEPGGARTKWPKKKKRKTKR